MEKNNSEEQIDLPDTDQVEGILNVGKEKKKFKVTWDEEQLAEHDKTRGNKMKIDEPKTPYVTDEEFRKLCEEDPDYIAEFGDEIKANNALYEAQMVDINSQEADKDEEMSDMDGQEILAGNNMQINMNIMQQDNAGANSDDELNQSPPKFTLQDHKLKVGSNKKNQCESSLDVVKQHVGGIQSTNPKNSQGMGGGSLGQGLDIMDLTSKLKGVNDDEEAEAKKKADFEAKRKKHYQSEFQMAKLLKQKQEMEDDYDEEDQQNEDK